MVDRVETNQERRDQPQPANGTHHIPSDAPPLSGRVVVLGLVLLTIVTVVVTVAGIIPRVRARSKLKEQTDALAAPNVIVNPPKQGQTAQEVVLPANIYAYSDASLYARTDGYLSKWYFDIGAHVREGQLLAIISSPEVDKQLLQAHADLATAEANAGLAKTNSTRYQGLLTQNAVSKQDTDTFVSQAASTSSAVKSAQANVQRLEELQSFEKIYAPFNGVITARNVDVGQLINAGSGTTQLFRISAINVLRVYVNVPQIYSQTAVPGTTAQITFSEFPGQSFTGKLVRTARAIDPTSRTLLVEIDLDNRDGKLMPGAYGQVHMNVHNQVVPMIVPVSALIFRTEGLQVGTVVKGPNGDEAKLVHVTMGQDDGSTVQVIQGLNADSQVIQNPPDSLIDGEPVHVVQPGKTEEENGSAQE
ncbi:MAG TPA: efflux RND transporter periplasmic adaptor subunit [Acidobacteriaceae bacterium]|nr:efflux RND transporter periplasmic adaptor subunit [Acidobacteriaceae bacterium]